MTPTQIAVLHYVGVYLAIPYAVLPSRMQQIQTIVSQWGWIARRWASNTSHMQLFVENMLIYACAISPVLSAIRFASGISVDILVLDVHE